MPPENDETYPPTHVFDVQSDGTIFRVTDVKIGPVGADPTDTASWMSLPVINNAVLRGVETPPRPLLIDLGDSKARLLNLDIDFRAGTTFVRPRRNGKPHLYITPGKDASQLPKVEAVLDDGTKIEIMGVRSIDAPMDGYDIDATEPGILGANHRNILPRITHDTLATYQTFLEEASYSLPLVPGGVVAEYRSRWMAEHKRAQNAVMGQYVPSADDFARMGLDAKPEPKPELDRVGIAIAAYRADLMGADSKPFMEQGPMIQQKYLKIADAVIAHMEGTES